MCFRLITIRALLLLILVATQISCGVFQATDNTPHHLQKAERYLRGERPDKAIKVVSSYLAQQDISSKNQVTANIFLGNIYFSLQRFRLARDHFQSARRLGPSNYDALHHYWAAALMVDPGNANKKLITAEINKVVANPDIETEGLLAGFYGYSYLWNKRKKRQILDVILTREPSPKVDKELPLLIMEQMMSTHSPTRGLAYVRQFLKRFPDHVNTPTMLSMLFNSRSANKILQDYSNSIKDISSANPYLHYYVARYRFLNPQPTINRSLLVKELLDRNIESSFFPCRDMQATRTCDYYRKKLIAGIYFLNAKMLFENKDYDNAISYVNKSIKSDPNSYKAWSLKGRLYTILSQHKQAETALVNALSIRPDHKPSILALRALRGTAQVGNDSIKKKISADRKTPFFRDVTKSAGLDKAKGQRVAWGDFDNDGFDDLLLDGRTLYKNENGKRFSDVTKLSGIPTRRSTTGGIFIDYDNDGQLDILVTGKQTILYKNTGGKFREAHIFNDKNHRRTVASGWGDINNDGYADLYLANYEKSAVLRSFCYQDQLFLNIDGNKFTDISNQKGITSPYALCGRGVSWADLDQDGDSEIIVSNYRLNRNRIFSKNDKVLNDISRKSGFQTTIGGHSIGSVIADFNGDHKPDIYLSNLAHPRYLDFSDTSKLFINNGTSHNIQFRIESDSGIGFSETNADVATADVDNDGDLDLYITAIYPHRYASLYLNNGRGKFENISWQSNTQAENSWGAAFSDFDNDGDSDLVVASNNGIRLFRNESGNSNSLTVLIQNRQCQRNGIGMKLWLTAGTKSQYREIQASKGTGTQDSGKILFGLGDYYGPLGLRGKDSCGHVYKWSGPSSVKTITFP